MLITKFLHIYLFKALTLAFLMPLTISAQNLTGNVTYKYNDFVGNRADLGAQAILYTMNDSATQKTLVDNNGEFQFSNLKPGRYAVAIISKNTNWDPFEKYLYLLEYDTKKFLGFSIKEMRPRLRDSIWVQFTKMDSIAKVLLTIKPISGRKYNQIDKHLIAETELAKSLISQMMDLIPINSALLPYNFFREISPKYHFEEIEIKEGATSRIVVDFETTYN